MKYGAKMSKNKGKKIEIGLRNERGTIERERTMCEIVKKNEKYHR